MLSCPQWRALVLIAVFFIATSCSSQSEDAPPQRSQAPAQQQMTPAKLDAAAATSLAQSTPNLYGVRESFTVGNAVYVRAMMVDPSRNSVWIGTSGGALEVDLTSRDLKKTYTRKAGLANEYVFALQADAQNRVWFGTNGGGVSRFDGENWKTYFPMHGLADYWVYSFGEQTDGSLWIGTWAGVNHFDPKTESFITYKKELVNEWVYGIAVDQRGQVWFGTEGGISMFDGRQWRAWTHKDGLGGANTKNLPINTNTGLGTRYRHDLSVASQGQDSYNPNYVFCVIEAKNGDIWAGTWGGGVSRFDGKQWTNITTADGLVGDVVFSIVQDASGAFWFGTHKGLSRYDGESWNTYSQRDGLIDDNVYALAAAPNGDIWVGTRGGVARLQKIEGH